MLDGGLAAEVLPLLDHGLVLFDLFVHEGRGVAVAQLVPEVPPAQVDSAGNPRMQLFALQELPRDLVLLVVFLQGDRDTVLETLQLDDVFAQRTDEVLLDELRRLLNSLSSLLLHALLIVYTRPIILEVEETAVYNLRASSGANGRVLRARASHSPQLNLPAWAAFRQPCEEVEREFPRS